MLYVLPVIIIAIFLLGHWDKFFARCAHKEARAFERKQFAGAAESFRCACRLPWCIVLEYSQHKVRSCNMAEQFLTLMADLDAESRALMCGWREKTQKAGYVGTQAPGLPRHIVLATFSLEKERETEEEMKRLAKEFSAIPVHISHIGIFSGAKSSLRRPI